MRFRNGLALLLVGVALMLLSACTNNGSKADTEPATAENQDSVVVVLDGADSVSVFDLLRQEHEVEFKSSLMGVFVSGIDSVYNGDGYFWVYSVNDSSGNTAADKRLTSNGDRVTWHYRRMGE